LCDFDHEYKRKIRLPKPPNLSHNTRVPTNRNFALDLPDLKLKGDSNNEALQEYTTAIGRKALKSQDETLLSHPSWELTQEELRQMQIAWTTKNLPNCAISFYWKLRHLCLYHPHGNSTCTHCHQPWDSLAHILRDCKFAEEVWILVETRIGIQVPKSAKLWGTWNRNSQLWKNRIHIALTTKTLWTAYWKATIDKTPTTAFDLESTCHLESIWHQKHYV
jgi:hypothetical protein